MDASRSEAPDVSAAAAIAALGLGTHDPEHVDERAVPALGDPSPRVRSAAVGALVRAGTASAAAEAWHRAIDDASPAVRRRTAELAPSLDARGPSGATVVPLLLARLDDADTTVIEAAAFALGELGTKAVAGGAVGALASTVTRHDDALAREAAVAALGALGDPAGLPAVLAACHDKATVRRRAVLALAPFDGPDVDAALAAALGDRDWQVRQAAEDLLPEDPLPEDPLPEESGD
jgi:HEAT repeat protein